MLDDLYDERTLARLDRAAVDRSAPLPVRRRFVAGAFVASIGLGIQDVLEDRQHEPVIEEVDAWDDDASLPVRLLWVPGNPAATIALVRA